MNTNDCDHPDLTAHVLGELDAEHDEAMARWIASRPEARAEAECIGELAQMLHATAPVSFHTLLPEQRAAVLTGPQRVRQMVAAVQQPRKRGMGYPMVWGALRLAAAAAVAAAAYVTGVHVGSTLNSTGSGGAAPIASTTPVEPVSSTRDKPKTPPFRAKEVPPPVVADASPVSSTPAAAPADTPKISEKAPVPASAPAKVEEAVVVVAAPKVELPPPAAAPQPKPVVVAQASNDFLAQPFVNTSKNGMAQVSLKPAATRPALTSPKGAADGPQFGSPMTVSPRKEKDTARSSKLPDLMIHSWKAEVASCPWDESHRLVRLVVQIPGEQPAAASTNNAYPLQVNFSTTAVRSFRQLGARIVPAQQADSPAFHIAWFEVVPNGPLAEGGTRSLGEITLPNARFTTQAMAPFDSSKLRVLDKGASWQAAHEDFLFESALAGFGLLLKGDRDTGSLNHSMVLDLAQRSRHDDRNGEYSRFIKLVNDAGHMTGVK